MKKSFVFLLSLIFAITAEGQLLGSLQLDPKDFIQIKDSSCIDICLLKNAIRPAFFLSRQSFQICDKKTGELYGLNNKDEFGTEISLGIKVKNGYVLTNKAIRPWEYNDKFEKYKDGYTPVPYSSQYSEFADDMKYDSLDVTESKINELLSSTLYLVTSNCLSDKGLTIDNTKGAKEGWIVWVCTKEEDLNKTAKLELICFSLSVEASENYDAEIETPDGLNVLGGIYIVPENREIGSIEFCISGIMVEKEGKWNLHFPFIGKEKIIKHTVKVKEENNDTLTLIDDMYSPKASKGKKKNKKKQ